MVINTASPIPRAPLETRLTKSNRRPGRNLMTRSFNTERSKAVLVKILRYRNKGNPVRIKMRCILFGTALYLRSNTPAKKK